MYIYVYVCVCVCERERLRVRVANILDCAIQINEWKLPSSYYVTLTFGEILLGEVWASLSRLDMW